ncbi:MAG: class I SAM-dependent methyltransferase [Ignavibacteriales bacterium]|nr:class I SAM-dependent methyltransferase [Ignavibacteriales bacterium]
MRYDPIKNIFGSVARKSPALRILFYKLLGVLFLREWHVKRALRQLLGRRTKPFTVYDAGSGFGQYSYYIAQTFPRAVIYAIDVKEEQVADCRAFFARRGLRQCTFAVEDLTHIQHDGKFDFILSVDVMEHIPDDVLVFKNFFRALKPHGVLFINTPSNLGGSDARGEDDPSFIEEHARNGYGYEEIKSKLESAGFTVESIRYTYGRWGSLSWRLAIKYPMVMAGVSKALLFVLPLYYLVALPLALPLMWLDYVSDNPTGTGLNVVARKR